MGTQIWQTPIKSIALELLSKEGFSMDQAADTILKSLVDWFTAVGGAGRRTHYDRIFLLVPKNQKLQPQRVLRAWQRAWE